MTIITTFIAGLIDGGSGIGKYNSSSIAAMVISLIVCLIVRAVCNIGSSKMSYLSSKTVKRNLRQMIYEKLLRMGASYNEKVKTSELVQVTVEGVDQLETYFGAYMPQFFYAMLAPLTLFVYQYQLHLCRPGPRSFYLNTGHNIQLLATHFWKILKGLQL